MKLAPGALLTVNLTFDEDPVAGRELGSDALSSRRHADINKRRDT